MKRFLAFLLFLPLFTIAMDKSWIGSYLTSEEQISVQRKKNATEALKKLLNELSSRRMYLGDSQHIVNEVKTLLSQGASPSEHYAHDNRIIVYSAEQGNSNVLQFFLKYHSPANTLDLALSKAAQNGYLDIVKLLIEKGAYVNTANDESRETPLLKAAENNYVQVAGYLLQKGANPNAQNYPYENTALIIASAKNNLKMVETLLNAKADPNIRNRRSDTPLTIAARHGNLEMAQMLLAHKADPNIVQHERKTPLIIAAENNNAPYNDYDLVKLLLEYNANPYLSDSFNRTPLYYAAQNAYPGIVELLLKSAKNINEKTSQAIESENRTPTSYLSLLPRDITRIIPTYFDYIDIPDKQGNTPLMAAVNNNRNFNVYLGNFIQASTVSKLLENGANPTLINQEGKTALDIARETAANPKIIKLLSDALAQQQLQRAP